MGSLVSTAGVGLVAGGTVAEEGDDPVQQRPQVQPVVVVVGAPAHQAGHCVPVTVVQEGLPARSVAGLQDPNRSWPGTIEPGVPASRHHVHRLEEQPRVAWKTGGCLDVVSEVWEHSGSPQFSNLSVPSKETTKQRKTTTYLVTVRTESARLWMKMPVVRRSSSPSWVGPSSGRSSIWVHSGIRGS